LWPVFITASRAPSKALHRAFLLIQDFEFTEYPHESTWVLLSSKELPATRPKTTTLPLPDDAGNDFAGLSFADINSFIRSNEDALRELKLSRLNWLIIDQKGLETFTSLVCEQYYSDGEDGIGGEFTNEFRACRVPFEESWIMFANLDVANMGFDDYVDQKAGKQEDGSWKWLGFTPETNATGRESEADVKRKKALKELRDGGYVD